MLIYCRNYNNKRALKTFQFIKPVSIKYNTVGEKNISRKKTFVKFLP